MSRICNLLVLVVYVLGAHALPMAHPLLHQHWHPRAVTPSAGDTAEHCCACHHHDDYHPKSDARSADARSERAHLVDGGQWSSSVPAHSHHCEETCALCLASHSPAGVIAAAEPAAMESLLTYLLPRMGSTRVPVGSLGELPEQRGPPGVDSAKSMAA